MKLFTSCTIAIALALSLSQVALATASSPVKAISCPQPPYPKGALALDQEGAVALIFSLFQDGTAREISIAATSGVTELDAAGVAGLQNCKFDTTGLSPTDLLTKRSIRFNFTIPNKISCPRLKYPEASLAASHQGTAKLNVRVEQDGKPVGYEILNSSGHKELDDAAIANAMACTFTRSETLERRWIQRDYSFKPNITKPVTLIGDCAPPEYPQRSQNEFEEGSVTIGLLVSETGQVVNSKILESSGFRRLDRVAEATLSNCKFSPETVDGSPRRGTYVQRFSFALGRKPSSTKCDGDDSFTSTQGYVCN